MKNVKIFTKNSLPIIIEDLDDEKIPEYSKQLSKILESNHVSILHTTAGSLIIRPNEITGIFITESEEPQTPEVGIETEDKKITKKALKPNKKIAPLNIHKEHTETKADEPHEDIITD
jgi:hypothetical protein